MTEAVIDKGFDRPGILERIGEIVSDTETRNKIVVHFFLGGTEEIDVEAKELEGIHVGESVIVSRKDNDQAELRRWVYHIRRK